jgi:8-oxo-dGTP pyrophosphatase MutT (NUDIX family)
MDAVKSCGFLVVRGQPIEQFLLMRHADRWDLPKGHVDPGETEMQCALRELVEETGIASADIDVDPEFRFESQYQVRGKRDGRLYDKSLIIFLARLVRDVPIACTEHQGYQWFAWRPPHRIQEWTIDPLLAAVARHVKGRVSR